MKRILFAILLLISLTTKAQFIDGTGHYCDSASWDTLIYTLIQNDNLQPVAVALDDVGYSFIFRCDTGKYVATRHWVDSLLSIKTSDSINGTYDYFPVFNKSGRSIGNSPLYISGTAMKIKYPYYISAPDSNYNFKFDTNTHVWLWQNPYAYYELADSNILFRANGKDGQITLCNIHKNTFDLEIEGINNQLSVTGDTAKLEIYNNGALGNPPALQIKDGTQGNGKVFTSDANGNGSWQTPSSTGSFSMSGGAVGQLVWLKSTTVGRADSNLCYDTTNHYVGIQTSHPNVSLQIGTNIGSPSAGDRALFIGAATHNSHLRMGQNTTNWFDMDWIYNSTGANAYETMGFTGAGAGTMLKFTQDGTMYAYNNINLTGAVATATTQVARDNSTKVATTQYVDSLYGGVDSIQVSGGSMIVNGYKRKIVQTDTARGSATALTVTLKNISRSELINIRYVKTTASDLTFTFPATALISQSCNGIVSGSTLKVNSTTSGVFTLTVQNFNGIYHIYCAQDVQ